MSTLDLFINEFQHSIPQASILTDATTLQTYAIDGVLPQVVVTPTTVEETAQTVALAHKHRLSLLPRLQYPQAKRWESENWRLSATSPDVVNANGARPKTPNGSALGGIPEQFDILLLMNKLDQLLEHEAPDLTCRVEAGMTLAALQAQLATQGQRLALDPPGAEQITIGGLLATNASGPRRFRYGTARDLVIGLSVVQANGEIAHSGGRVVKNVAGYDLNKLYIGSLGTLGVIVEANFKLHPLPPSERTLLLTFVTLQDTMQTVIAISASLLQPTALELIDPKAARTMTNTFGLNLPTNGYILAVHFEGSPSSIERQIDETRSLARQSNALIGDDLAEDEQVHFWDIIRARTQGVLTCKVSLMVSQVAAYLNHVTQVCHRQNLAAEVVGHVGNGILYVELSPNDATQRLAAAISELRTHARVAHGHLIVERCPLDLKRRISIWGEPENNFYMMQRLKQQFDPQNTFVKGRFLGGL